MQQQTMPPVLAALNSKWGMSVVYVLSSQACITFTEMLDALGGVSPSTLSARLKDLKAQELVEQKIYCQNPPRFCYSLTERGVRLANSVKQLAAI